MAYDLRGSGWLAGRLFTCLFVSVVAVLICRRLRRCVIDDYTLRRHVPAYLYGYVGTRTPLCHGHVAVLVARAVELFATANDLSMRAAPNRRVAVP